MPDHILFYIIFLSQIILISYYYPKKIIARISNVVEKYPPDAYPKLYPVSLDKINKGKKIYWVINLIILTIGLALMFVYGMLSGEYQANQKHAEGLPLMFGMVQFIPILLLEISGFKQFKLMRASDSRTSRKAELSPRRLFDFISPIALGFAVVLIFSYIIIDIYINDFIWTSDIIIKIIALALSTILFICLTYWHLSGKKLDPYQANKDRINQIRFSIRSMVFVSAFLSIFMLVTSLIEVFQLAHLEIIVNSLYFQVIAFYGVGAMLKTISIENIDFDVYKKDISLQ